MLRSGLFVLLGVALVACSSPATTTAPSQSVAAAASSAAASTAPTAEPTVEATPEPTPVPRAAMDFIVTAADVPSEFGTLTGLTLGADTNATEITQESLPDWEDPSDATKILEQGFVSGYIASFPYGTTNLSSTAYVFDNPEGALAYLADEVASFVSAGCTDVSDTIAAIGAASSALRCPEISVVEATAFVIFVTDNAVMTLRIKAMYGESEPNLEGLAEIARSLEARVAS